MNQPSKTTSPRQLLRRLFVLAVASSMLVLGGSIFGIHWVYQRHVITNAEMDAISISKSILALQSHFLFKEQHPGQEVTDINIASLEGLDFSLAQFLTPFHIIKIKVFDRNGTIIYSTDKDLIGLQDPMNERLHNALQGLNDSRFVVKEKIADLKSEQRFDIDVVESYVPIFNNQGNTVGSFEIYKDVTNFRNDIRIGVTLSFFILAGIILIAFSVSYLLIKKSASQLSLAQQKLHHMATIDALTGIYSRNEIISLLQSEFENYKLNLNTPAQSELSLVMIDVDHFKAINDNHGHPIGDKALSTISACIKTKIRNVNGFGRFGGEEFLLVLPGETGETSKLVAERIRQAISELEIEAEQQLIKVTASFGIASALPSEPDYHSTVKRADNALYQAKNSGRNKVVLYQDL
ncbi:MAG: GGDEF domain-containing protein [Gammaproteobacteria bacterium]|nr:GGDEF domain-containing protein [Gammaproteobacteria bacterium]